MKALLATILAALAAPAAAFSSGPTMIVRDVPLRPGARTPASVTPRFNMVAVHWRGAGTVEFRTRAHAGVWSSWQTPDDDPIWTGTANAIRFRTVGRVARLRAYYIWSPAERTLSRRLAIADAPPIIPRLSWGADESIRRAKPKIEPAIHFAVVHHTAGSNNYTAAQSAAIVRGIELYHVQGNGWNDIGYNFLVDKYGQVFEGRYGGVDKAVVGAHSLGFNTGSVGVAVLGEYGRAGISAAAKTSLEQLLAWRLDLAHVDPLSTLTWQSGGNPRFPAGVAVLLRSISGHRDTNFTDCPGNALYAQLPQIAKDVAALGAPKLYAPLAVGKLGGPVHFTARLTSALPWSVTVTDPTGLVVAQGTGTGTLVDWTWDATTAALQRYTWAIATPGARSGTGAIGTGSISLALEKPMAAPSLVSPGGDPADDSTLISYTLTAPATVSASFVDANGQVLSPLFSEAKAAGAQSFTFTPAAGVPLGQYSVQLTATTTTGRTASAGVPFAIDDTLAAFASSTASFSSAKPAGVSLMFTLTRPVSAELQVLRGATVVATPLAGPLAAGLQTLTWDGTAADGATAPDGTYVLSLALTDPFTTFTKTATVTVDSTPPAIKVLSYRLMRFRVSEPAVLTLVVGARRYTRALKQPKTVSFWLAQKPRAYRLVVADAAGNTSVLRYRSR